MRKRILFLARFLLFLVMVGGALWVLDSNRLERTISDIVFKLWTGEERRVARFTKCQKRLSERGAKFAALEDWKNPRGCSKRGSIRLTALGETRLSSPIILTCSVAESLYDWIDYSVRPAAQKTFDEPLKKVHHWGGFSCRTIAGRSRLSEHAFSNAIDIHSFSLASGKRISVEKDWGDGNNGRFLTKIAKGACRPFRVVLTPNYNEAHHDHFHFDRGPFKRCGV